MKGKKIQKESGWNDILTMGNEVWSDDEEGNREREVVRMQTHREGKKEWNIKIESCYKKKLVNTERKKKDNESCVINEEGKKFLDWKKIHMLNDGTLSFKR